MADNIVNVRVEYSKVLNQRFLLSADRHWDNPLSDTKMQRRHLDQAKSLGTGIIDIGDLFCAMQGKYDKRSSKSSLRPEHQNGEYFDSLIDTGADFFEPYAKNIITLGMGNHETAVMGRHEINLTSRLCKELNKRAGTTITNGGYSGWVNFHFIDSRSKHKTVFKLWYIHGYGGGGPVTRGVIQSNRKSVYMPDANIIASGHIHEDWCLTNVRVRTREDGTTYLDEQYHVQVPTYKEEYGNGSGGWHIETGKPPKPIGATWLLFQKLGKDCPITFDTLRAR